MSGRQLIGALAAIAVLTLLLPPLGAFQVHARRIARAHDEVQRIAEELGANGEATMAAVSRIAGGARIALAGPGTAPRFAPGTGWTDARTLTITAVAPELLSSSALVPDPWGNQYLVAVGGGRGGRLSVLSAGPNGIVETRFDDTARPRGDDVEAGR